MYVVLSFIIGILVTLMIELNGVLQNAVGGTTALLSIHIFGIATALLFLLFAGKRLKGDSSKKAPLIFLLAGIIGSSVSYLQSVSFLKGGILMSLSGSLAGQILAASASESFYLADRKKSPLLQRIVAPILLLPGSIIIGIKADVSFFWIIVSWLPGILLMVQQNMNSINMAVYGPPKTVVINFTSALLIIFPLFLFSSGPAPVSEHVLAKWSNLSQLPWYVISGGGILGVLATGSIAFLLLKAPALLVMLGMYSGELFSGVLLDVWAGNTIVIEKVIGLILIAAGLSIGKIKKKSKQESRP